ncbi:hypothetical protein LCGC14_0274240 [marine sediment metagenome]|uniref:Uncharacterized protein n=1 Tax=marine sediment metagenome TaxID=412755 RepID=A0A0F9UF58_9ZZZZ
MTKTVGGRVPFEPGTKVWDKLTNQGPWMIVEDDGGETVKVYTGG